MENVAYRVIAANRAPDHSTIAEFRVQHEQALADLFGGVLELCKQAGLVSVGVIAVDGTKVVANASSYANVDYKRIAREILEEAARIDRFQRRGRPAVSSEWRLTNATHNLFKLHRHRLAAATG